MQPYRAPDTSQYDEIITERLEPWIGVDLDGTLAEHYWPQEGPYTHDKIGVPIPPMVARVRDLLHQGRRVKIFTARVGPQPGNLRKESDVAIRQWCLKHIGVELEVTATKDYGMIALYDDRAIRVEQDTGAICSGCQQ